jgi:histidine triad (HIT) family protein
MQFMPSPAARRLLFVVECVFCNLVQDLSKAYVVSQSDVCVAVLDIKPAAPGHTLVMPRAHLENLWDLDVETAGALMVTVRSVAQLLRERLQPDGLTLRQNNGAASGQRIPHLHIHLVPRWEGDGHIGWPAAQPEPIDNASVLRVLLPRD